MGRSRWRTHRGKFLAIVLAAALTLAASAVNGQVSDDLRKTLDALESPDGSERLSAANALTANWRATLPGLVAALDSYDRDAPLFVNQTPKGLLPLTDVVRTIVVNMDGGTRVFRKINTDKTIRVLAWAARSENQALRLNATFILANVIDNNYLCLVLRHLGDPSISETGIVNLLQVAASAASYANDENVKAMLDTIRGVQGRLGPKSRAIADSLLRRAEDSRNSNQSLPPDSFCKTYNYSQPP